MAKKIFFVIAFLINAALWAQQEKISVPQHQLKLVQDSPEMLGDTIPLPFEDDFAYLSTSPSSNFWVDQKAFVNQSMALNVKSVGVATLDGLDEFGYAYNIKSSRTDTLADVLTSRYIDLSNTLDTVMLSFLYQGGGLGEVPEANDSLIVDFWSVDDSTWKRVWKVGAVSDPIFRYGVVRVTDSQYLQKGFRFRIGAIGSLQGAYDNWHIDYVELNDRRTSIDTVVLDPAFVQPHPVITLAYENIPWFHIDPLLIKDSLNHVYRRNGPAPSGGWTLNMGKYEMFENSTLVGTRPVGQIITTLDHNQSLDLPVPLDATGISALDEFTLKMKTWFDGTNEGTRQNDTVYLSQEFKNYYAYDDGTAERAYGILNSGVGITAFKFKALEVDDLMGLYLNFVQAEEDASDHGFRIGIWESVNDEPGNLIYLTDSIYYPKYGPVANSFHPYILDTVLPLSLVDYYIGVRQTQARPLNIGLDLNNTDRSPIYYGDGNNWFPSNSNATLMMRPIVRYLPRDLSVKAYEKEFEFRIYPNPTRDRIHVLGLKKLTNARVYNLQGQVVWDGQLGPEGIDVSGLPSGMYFLEISLSTGKEIIGRIVKQ